MHYPHKIEKIPITHILEYTWKLPAINYIASKITPPITLEKL